MPNNLFHKPERATIGFAFSFVGAVLILAEGLVRIAAGGIITFAGSDEFSEDSSQD